MSDHKAVVAYAAATAQHDSTCIQVAHTDTTCHVPRIHQAAAY